MPYVTPPPPHPLNQKILTRQNLVQVVLERKERNIFLRDDTALNLNTGTRESICAIAILKERVAWFSSCQLWPENMAADSILITGNVIS
jgi:hypothetical protein